MDYLIDRETLMASVEEEVSRVADTAYSDDGTSLYDGIAIMSSDRDTVGKYLDDAISGIVHRTEDIATVGEDSISFDVPGFDMSKEDIARRELDRYLVMSVCALWFQDRYADKVEEFTQKAKTALDKGVGLLKSIKLREDFTW